MCVTVPNFKKLGPSQQILRRIPVLNFTKMWYIVQSLMKSLKWKNTQKDGQTEVICKEAFF